MVRFPLFSMCFALTNAWSLLGFFVALFMSTMYILIGRRRKSTNHTNWPMIVAAVTMMLLATAQLAVDISNIFQAFMYRSRLERLLFLMNVTNPIFAAKHAVYFTQMLVGDVILVCSLDFLTNACAANAPLVDSDLSSLCCLVKGLGHYSPYALLLGLF
jgi:hypothetical protein